MIDIEYMEKKLANNELTDSEISDIDSELMEIVRDELTDEQFNKWVMAWIDIEEIIDKIQGWDTETQLETIKSLRKIIK